MRAGASGVMLACLVVTTGLIGLAKAGLASAEVAASSRAEVLLIHEAASGRTHILRRTVTSSPLVPVPDLRHARTPPDPRATRVDPFDLLGRIVETRRAVEARYRIGGLTAVGYVVRRLGRSGSGSGTGKATGTKEEDVGSGVIVSSSVGAVPRLPAVAGELRIYFIGPARATATLDPEHERAWPGRVLYARTLEPAEQNRLAPLLGGVILPPMPWVTVLTSTGATDGDLYFAAAADQHWVTPPARITVVPVPLPLDIAALLLALGAWRARRVRAR